MHFFVTVKTRARAEHVEPIDATHFSVSVKAAPVEGKANMAVERLLARYLGVPRSRLALRSGTTGKRKVFDFKTE
ncbi:MAG: DUF167 domain-containing protein [Candidatus Moraniibacteriota bacterium]